MGIFAQSTDMKLHFIAIGGSAMHNLAIALARKGYQVSGSDDEIFEPSRSRLKKYGLLPEKVGWFPEKITAGLDAIVLGMHAREDNPELLKAREAGIRIYSYPEYLYEQAREKKRVVIGGSHGKTTITSMILHVMQQQGIDCDYMVGAQLEGFEVMVKITAEASVMVLEGDEYLTSPLDRRPKFHVYRPDIGLISGIAWDHINVFPTFGNYVEQFRIFADQVTPGGVLVYCREDEEVRRIGEATRSDVKKKPYGLPEHIVKDGITSILYEGRSYPLNVFGDHNLLNINGARLVCEELGIRAEDFYDAIRSFGGASRRLELVARSDDAAIFKDFAHSPSKLRATTEAVRKQFPGRELVACIELHTYSSLSENFLSHYDRCLAAADIGIVYFSPHALALKRLPSLTREQVARAFGGDNIQVFTEPEELRAFLLSMNWKNRNLLMMSSGNFDGLRVEDLGAAITKG